MNTCSRVVLLCLLLVACAAGPSPEQQRLDRTYGFVKRTLLQIGTNELAALSFQSAIETGATPVDYLVASMPDNADMVFIDWEGSGRPWSVIIRDGPGDNDFVLEAFAESAAQPVRSETITVRPLTPR